MRMRWCNIQDAEYYRSNIIHAEVDILRGGSGGFVSETADDFPAMSS
jgi:hypothetical protein